MFASDIDFKKDLMAHNIFSTWQFIQNAKKNLDIASFAATTITNIISNMTNETVKWEQDLFRGFRDSGDKQVSGAFPRRRRSEEYAFQNRLVQLQNRY